MTYFFSILFVYSFLTYYYLNILGIYFRVVVVLLYFTTIFVSYFFAALIIVILKSSHICSFLSKKTFIYFYIFFKMFCYMVLFQFVLFEAFLSFFLFYFSVPSANSIKHVFFCLIYISPITLRGTFFFDVLYTCTIRLFH